MKPLLAIIKLDILESFRSKWFIAYSLLFVLLVSGIFMSGVTDSRVLGFTGLTRLLLVFIQSCNIILPIFILISTVRTIAKERENNIFEYMLSFPVSVAAYYWGKAIGRFVVVFIPLFLSLVLALLFALFTGNDIPYRITFLYLGLLTGSCMVFLGLGFFISSWARSQELALGVALFLWILLIALIDIALIGFMIRQTLPENLIFSIALLNPIQVFRIGAIALFDPVLSVIGPASYYILDTFGRVGFICYSLIYPVILGLIFLGLGFFVFQRKDLV